MVTCADCGREFDSTQKGAWRRVEGWVTVGRGNIVREMQPTNLYRCPQCGKRRMLGVLPDQIEMVFE